MAVAESISPLAFQQQRHDTSAIATPSQPALSAATTRPLSGDAPSRSAVRSQSTGRPGRRQRGSCRCSRCRTTGAPIATGEASTTIDGSRPSPTQHHGQRARPFPRWQCQGTRARESRTHDLDRASSARPESAFRRTVPPRVADSRDLVLHGRARASAGTHPKKYFTCDSPMMIAAALVNPLTTA